jgi:putative pre-16S rRNA nuclease
MRVLGIDPGERRIGIAISDPGGKIAVPVSVYQRNGNAAVNELSALARREEAELIVVGLAISLDGHRGPQAERAERFGLALERTSGIPVVFWDERFSTYEAGRLLIEAGTSRRHRKHNIDAAAAAVILQDYLDSQQTLKPSDQGLEPRSS